MCGIAGFYGQGDMPHLQAMTTALAHRGPDATGHVCVEEKYVPGEGLYLGHTRLAILDIAHGQQPIHDASTGLTMVYNGEIYNHQELREELQNLGHRFVTSHSDTETVLRAFVQWGPDAFAKFNGMFALAIHDARRHLLWLARDPFGEKPLFYAHLAQGFAFASEIGALHCLPDFDSSQDIGNIQRYYAWGYMPGVRTLHPRCFSVPHGAWLRLDLKTGSPKIHHYSRFVPEPDESLGPHKEESLVEELRHLLVQAVQRRFLSDVPIGLFLSGGIDSSSILAAACRLFPPEQIEAFTVGFTEKSYDESPQASAVAKAFGVRHYLSLLTQEGMCQQAIPLLQRMSEPLGDASLIPTHQLAAFARQRVTVTLSGDGGDELFAGYDPFLALKPASIYSRIIPAPLHNLLRRCSNALPVSDKNMSLEFKIRRTLRGLSYPEGMRIPAWMGPLEPAEFQDFFSSPLSAEELYEDALHLWEQHPKLHTTDKALLFFTNFYLPNDILVKVDRASMLVSLESRAVFLDKDIAAFCARLPHHFKLRGQQRKYILKKALHGWLPKTILALPKKGFGIPLNQWLRNLPMPKGSVPGMNASAVHSRQMEHGCRKGDHRLFLWSHLAMHCLNSKGSAHA